MGGVSLPAAETAVVPGRGIEYDGLGAGEEFPPQWPAARRVAAHLGAAPAPADSDFYRLGDGLLEVRSADPGFRDRLATLYRECRITERDTEDLPRVTCTVRVAQGGDVGLATIADPEPLDLSDFALQIFPDRGYRELASAAHDWRVLALGNDDDVSVAIGGDQLLFRMRDPWRALVGSLAVSRLIRAQRRLLFFHAASVGLGSRGLLVMGPKGAGKTTLSLALAARGHAFLGDEIASVRLGSFDIVPLRRSLAIRTGLRDDSVSQALQRVTAPTEIYPDGSERLRAQAADLFPGSWAPCSPLQAIVFLRGFGNVPELERFEPGPQHLRDLTPMGATLWAASPGRRAFDMMSLLARSRCYRMVLGGPEQSAALVESVMEG